MEKQIENKWLVVEFTSFGEVLSRGELFLSNPRATSPGRTKHKGKLSLRSCAGDGRLTDEPRIKVSSKERWLTANNFQHSRGLIKDQ